MFASIYVHPQVRLFTVNETTCELNKVYQKMIEKKILLLLLRSGLSVEISILSLCLISLYLYVWH